MKASNRKVWGFILLFVGLVLCAAGLWQLASPARYSASTRIKSDGDLSETPDLRELRNGPPYDPHFIATEFEVIQSQLVLGDVIKHLHLDEEWGKRYGGGEKLRMSETIALLKRRLELRPVRGTSLIQIRIISEDPGETARIANAIAESYKDWRRQDRRQIVVMVLENRLNHLKEAEGKVKAVQEELDKLKKQFNVSDSVVEEEVRTNYPAVWKAKQALEEAEQNRGEWMSKVSAARIRSQMISDPVVEIADPAVPPETPISPNRPLGIVLLAAGLVAVLCGVFLMNARKKTAVSSGGTSYTSP